MAFDSSQERDGVKDVGRVAGGDAGLAGHLGTYGQKGGVTPFGDHRDLKIVDRSTEAGVDAHGENAVDLCLDDVAGKAIGGNAIAHHPPRERCPLVEDHAMPEPAQMVRGSEPAGTGADDENSPAGGHRGRIRTPPFAQRPVAEKPFDRVDPDRLVHGGAVARRLAGVEAGATHDRRKRIVEHDLAPRRLVGTILGVVEPLLDVLPGRAGVVARWQAVHVDGSLHPPRSCPVGQARADVEGDGERLVHQSPLSASSASP